MIEELILQYLQEKMNEQSPQVPVFFERPKNLPATISIQRRSLYSHMLRVSTRLPV